MPLELIFAIKEMNKITKRYQDIGYFTLIELVTNHLVGQGFSHDYSQRIAEQAFDLL